MYNLKLKLTKLIIKIDRNNFIITKELKKFSFVFIKWFIIITIVIFELISLTKINHHIFLPQTHKIPHSPHLFTSFQTQPPSNSSGFRSCYT